MTQVTSEIPTVTSEAPIMAFEASQVQLKILVTRFNILAHSLFHFFAMNKILLHVTGNSIFTAKDFGRGDFSLVTVHYRQIFICILASL